MTTADGVAYVQSVLREDGNSDRVTLLQLIMAANAGCVDMFLQSRCAKASLTQTTVPLQSTYLMNPNIFQIDRVTYDGHELHPHRVTHTQFWNGCEPQSYMQESFGSITLHPKPHAAKALVVTGYITPDVNNILYPLLTIIDALPDPLPSPAPTYTPITGGFTTPMLTTTLPTPAPLDVVTKYAVDDEGTITIVDVLTDPPPASYQTIYAYAGVTTTKYVVGTFNLTPDCDNGPWDYAIMRLAATVLADDAGAQVRAKSCGALYAQAWKALSSRMYG